MRLNPVIRLITLLAVIAGGVFAIRMSPAAFTAQNIPIGMEFDLGVPLVIRLSENDTVAKYFTATPLKPGEVRNDWLDGYEEIPDAGYLKIEGDGAVYVEPDKPVTRRLLIEFPEDSSLLNRHFLVQLRVMPQEASGMFQAVLVGSYLLETSPSKDRFTKPGGYPLSVAPSRLSLDSAGFGVVRIYNNHEHTLKVLTRLDIPPNTEKLHVELTRGFVRGVLGDGIELDKKELFIQPGGFEDITIIMDADLRDSISRNSEYILWVETPEIENSRRFVRVHYLP